MLNAADPKFRKWKTIKREFRKLDEEPASEAATVRDDSDLCLTHGYHHHKSYAFKDVIRCSAYRSNAVTEEFIINHGFGTGNVLQIKSFGKDAQAIEAAKEEDAIENGSNISKDEELIYINSPPLQHLVWLQKHRIFVGIGLDKNLRVFSDTVNRCQTLSAPTCCTMPVICLVYLEETDEVVTAGLGVIQPWKIRFSGSMLLSEEPDTEQVGPKKKKTRSEQGENPPETKRARFGQGGQMLQQNPSYCCDLEEQEWVTSLRVYSEAKTKSRIAPSKHVLVATAADIVIAIDYVKRVQLWSARLSSTFAENPSAKSPQKRKRKTERKKASPKASASSYVIEGHVSLTACEFYPRLGYFITGGGEGMIQIMQLVNFGSVTTLRGHRFAITGLVAHGRYPILISSSKDGCIRIWCLETFRENQRIDTGQHIESISMSENNKFFFLHSKKMIGMYFYHKLHSLYSIPHSVPQWMCPIQADTPRGCNGRILVSLSDGSVALLSPTTGLMITMVYPMTTFQIFNDMTFDIYREMCYMRLQDGSILQCDCSANPSAPLQCFKPAIPFDEDVCSLTSVRVQYSDRFATPVTAVIAGLCNGQIILVRPNFLWMDSVQAHVGPVEFLLTIPDVKPKSVETAYCRDRVISTGPGSVRIWHIMIGEFEELPEGDITIRHGKVATMLFWLQPVLEVYPPDEALNPTFVSALQDRLCIVKEDTELIVLEINMSFMSPAFRRLSEAAENVFVQSTKKQFTKNDRTHSIASEQDEGVESELQKQRSGIDRIRHSEEEMQRFEEHGTLVHTHDEEDRHVGKITTLASAQALRFFASGSEDGLVKLWDENNRLLRELCFLPNPVTAISFVNGRDLLVAVEGRIFAVECSAFLTKELITKRRIADLNFTEMPSEDAFPYNNNIAIVSNIEHLPTLALMATTRANVPDKITEAVARRLVIDGEHGIGPMERFTVTPRTQEYFNVCSDTDLRDLEGFTRQSAIQANLFSGVARRRTVRPTAFKSRRNARARKEDMEEGVVLIANQNIQKKRKSYEDFEEFLKDSAIAENESNEDIESTQEDSQSYVAENEANLKDDKNVNEKILKHPVAPDGYIPNSVVRMIVKPPPPPPLPPPSLTKASSTAGIDFSLLNSEYERLLYMDTDSESLLKCDHAKIDAALQSKHQAMSSGDTSNAIADVGKLHDLTDPGLHQKLKNSDDEAAMYDIDLFNFDDDLDEYKKYGMHQSLAAKLSFQPQRYRSFQDEDEGSNNILPFGPKTKAGKGIVPKYGKVVRAPTVSSTKSQGSEQSLDQIHDDIGVSEKENIFAETLEAMTQNLAKNKKEISGAEKTKADMVAKLQQQKDEVEKKPNIHPLLQEITTAKWFRAKLNNKSPEAVVEALLKIGDTTRVVAHQKVCEYLTRLLKTFGPKESEQDLTNVFGDDATKKKMARLLKPLGNSQEGKEPKGDSLCSQTAERIRRFIASFLTPRYSIASTTIDGRPHSRLDEEEEQRKRDERKKQNPNRVQLAHSALDAIESGVGMTEDIAAGIIRLTADENQGIRERAKKLLADKLNIDSRQKLISKLKDLVGGEVEAKSKPPTHNQDEAIKDLGERVKQGRLSLGANSRFAQRLFPRRFTTGESPTSPLADERQAADRQYLATTSRGGRMDGEFSFPPDEEKKNEKRRVSFHVPKDKLEERGESLSMTKFGKIDWRKAVPKPTKDTIKIMRTMKTVHAALRKQSRKDSAAKIEKLKARRQSSKRDDESELSKQSSQILSKQTSQMHPPTESSSTAASTSGGDEERSSNMTQIQLLIGTDESSLVTTVEESVKSSSPFEDDATSDVVISGAVTSDVVPSNVVASDVVTSDAVTSDVAASHVVASDVVTSDAVTSDAVTSNILTSDVTGSVHLPPLNIKSRLTGIISSSSDSYDTRQLTSGGTLDDLTDSAVESSEYTMPYTHLPYKDKDKKKSTVRQLQKQAMRDEDSGYTGSTPKSVETFSTDWRHSLKSLAQRKASRPGAANKKHSIRQQSSEKLQRLSPLKLDAATSVPSLPPIDSVAAGEPLDGEEPPVERCVKVDVGTDNPEFESRQISKVSFLSGRLKQKTRPVMSNKIKHGSFCWMKQAVVNPHLCNALSLARFSSYNVTTRPEPRSIATRRGNVGILPPKTTNHNGRSDTVATARSREEEPKFKLPAIGADNPLSFYHVKTKELQSMLANRVLPRRSKLKLPNIPQELLTSSKRTITIRIPSCNSKVLCATPSDVTDFNT